MMEVDENDVNHPFFIKYRPITVPVSSSVKKYYEVYPGETISSDDVVMFLENLSPIYEFEYSHISRKNPNLSLGYEIKAVDEINTIYLMINPEFHHLSRIPSNSLVISHHKIGYYKNAIYEGMLKLAEINKFNIYNFHLAWDTMEGGICDSFLFNLGFRKNQYIKVDLPYRGHQVRNLGAILKMEYPLPALITRLNSMRVDPRIIFNPHCKNSKIGFIPGGGFSDQMIIAMAELGVDVLISSDHNWVAETIAREVGMTLIDINHYVSECYGLQTMQTILTKAFPTTPTTFLENIDIIQCDPVGCNCGNTEQLNDCACK
jgi:putative NIF3 family GTP cyclohydrolase 1 type 2